jgi:hypothetical protein
MIVSPKKIYMLRMMDNEFKTFTKNVIDPIKAKAINYARDNFNSLNKEIVKEYNKKLEKAKFPFKNGLIPWATIGTGVYDDNLYQQQLEKRKKESSWMEKGKMLKNAAFSKLQKEDKISILKKLFDKLEAKYMKDNAKDTTVKILRKLFFDPHEILFCPWR